MNDDVRHTRPHFLDDVGADARAALELAAMSRDVARVHGSRAREEARSEPNEVSQSCLAHRRRREHWWQLPLRQCYGRVVRRVCSSALLWLLGACSARPPLRADPDVLARGHALALAAVEAHGGLPRWRALGGVALHLHAAGPYYPREADYLFDPARNRAVARFADKHGAAVEWRYDAKHGTIVENGRCVGSAKRRALVGGLLSNLLFWFGVPFKLVDEGAMQRASTAIATSSPTITSVTHRATGTSSRSRPIAA